MREPSPDAARAERTEPEFARDGSRALVAPETQPEFAAGPTPIAPGTLIAGKFRVERCLGAGGMGAVYAVRHELTRHHRALKLLHPEREAQPDLVRRLLTEASAAGRAGSPHLVETFDAGTLPSGAPYLVMELLTGLDLRALMDREIRLPPALACELVAQAAEGMAAAHRAGIIHRDLKPENLFVVDRPEGPFVKVLDFGISKFSSESSFHTGSTQMGAVYGTPAYMAPEQFRSARDADARADVFALGAVLFECLSGETPFDAPSLPAVGARIIIGQSTALAKLRPDLDPALIALVERAIAYEPQQRIPSARALVEQLGPFRHGAAAVPIAFPAQISASLPPESLAPAASSAGKRAFAVLMAALCALGMAILVRQLREAPAQRAPKPAQIMAPASPPAPATRPLLETAPTLDAIAPGSAPTSPPAASSARIPHARPGVPKERGGTRDAESDAAVSRSRVKQLGLSERNPFQ